MKDDLSGFAEEARSVKLADPVYDPATRRDPANDFGFEGATIFKANGKYYFGSTDKVHGRYSMCMGISDTIYAPIMDATRLFPAMVGPISSRGRMVIGIPHYLAMTAVLRGVRNRALSA